MEIENCIIYLIGFAGTGKLTIATEIQRMLSSILVDNHSILNVLFRLIDTDGMTSLDPSIWEKARKVRAAALDTIREHSKPRRNFIFTNELLNDSDVDAELFQEVADLAAARHAFLFPVRLSIDIDELCVRVATPDRKAKLKGVNPISARARAESKELLVPPCPHLNLDVTTLPAVKSARVILDELERRLVQVGSRHS